MRLLGVSAVLVLLSAALSTGTPVKSPLPLPVDSVVKDDVVNYRLSGDVVPSHYQVTITPNLDAWTFDGHVIIHAAATVTNVREIVLLANILTIKTVKVYLPSNDSVNFHDGLSTSHDAVTHKLTIPIDREMDPNATYYIEIEFSGEMRDDMAGFYRSTYTENGVQKRLATTQFQTTSARRAFPCFDEPKYKATFDITIIRTAQYNTVSNARLKETITRTDGLFEDVFETTPKMSTYLVAFIVSEYTPRADSRFGVWARPEMHPHSEYAYEVGVKLLEYYDRMTDYAYYDVLPKMDMAGIPDFSAGAMENWGLLTYRESMFLVDPDKTTALTKQRTANIISHEQAHMWFGNLVTCDWWESSWLNEGFAQYFQYFGTATVETTWDLELQFVVEQLQGVFNMDSSNSTHPMTNPVNSPSEVSGMFSSVVYSKGSSIIRMMEHLMGSDKFFAALRKYLKANEFSTSVPAKLFAALTAEADGYDMASIMGGWTTQEGYPVLNVEVNAEGTSAKLSQRRFLMANSAHTDDSLYPIPVTYATPAKGFLDTSAATVMTTKEATLDIEGGDSWVIFNTQQVGFYRVNYDEASWHKLHQALQEENHGGIHVLNRAQIVDDVLNLARGGLLDYQMAFDVLDFLPTETNYIPWLSAVNGLSYLSRRLAGEHQEVFGEYVKKAMENIYQKLGFYPKATDRQTEIYNRGQVLQWLCRYHHEDCVANAKAEFEKARADPTYLVPVDIRTVVNCIGARHGGKDAYDWLWSRYQAEQMATEQSQLLNAMGCTTDEEVLQTHLARIFSTAVRNQDKSSAFSATLAYHDENVDSVFNYIKNNHAYMAQHLGSYGSVASYMSNLGQRFTRDEQIAALTSFADAQTGLFGASDSTLRATVRTAQFEMYWDSKNLATVASIIDTKVNGGAMGVSVGLGAIMVACGVLLNNIFRN